VKCPHCTVTIHPNFDEAIVGNIPKICQDVSGTWFTKHGVCPACQKAIIYLVTNRHTTGTGGRQLAPIRNEILVYPKGMTRSPLSTDVPEKFAEDYREACLVLADSPKASAALSRRCLQVVLLDAAQTKEKHELAKQIDEVLPTLPPYLRSQVDAVRVVGNFAAHPIKSKHTGEIIPVEPGEAELLLDVVEGLFDFYFVLPAAAAKKNQAINDKLKEAGKPPMK